MAEEIDDNLVGHSTNRVLLDVIIGELGGRVVLEHRQGAPYPGNVLGTRIDE